MYSARRIIVRTNHALFPYFDATARAANNLYNASLFRIRQVMTATKKDPKDVTANEAEVMQEIEDCLPVMNQLKAAAHDKRYKAGRATSSEPVLFDMPTAEKWMLSYSFLLYLFGVSSNPDFHAPSLSKQTAQNVVKQVTKDMKSFFNATRGYTKDPSKFTGKPKLPHYHKKSGSCTVTLTNQDCKLTEREDGKTYLAFPYTKERICLGSVDVFKARLKQVTVTPSHGVFIISAVLDDGMETPKTNDRPQRICAIDFGVDNIAAISSNIGKECLLFKGGVIKAANQWYNKRLADIMSRQTKGTTKKFVSTPETDALLIKRENIMCDFMHKVSKTIIDWCIENEIDTIVAGTNKFWKQNINIGHVNNQEFVQVPFDKLRRFLQYRAERVGIRYLEQEESYTSKASYPDKDPVPVYGEMDADKVKFSGKRKPLRYKGMYKKDGFRGLYATKDGTIINSDLNGAANIGRKALEEFDHGQTPDFTQCVIIVHPDLVRRKTIQQRQKTNAKPVSKSKQRRLMRKNNK